MDPRGMISRPPPPLLASSFIPQIHSIQRGSELVWTNTRLEEKDLERQRHRRGGKRDLSLSWSHCRWTETKLAEALQKPHRVDMSSTVNPLVLYSLCLIVGSVWSQSSTHDAFIIQYLERRLLQMEVSFCLSHIRSDSFLYYFIIHLWANGSFESFIRVTLSAVHLAAMFLACWCSLSVFHKAFLTLEWADVDLSEHFLHICSNKLCCRYRLWSCCMCKCVLWKSCWLQDVCRVQSVTQLLTAKSMTVQGLQVPLFMNKELL